MPWAITCRPSRTSVWLAPIGHFGERSGPGRAGQNCPPCNRGWIRQQLLAIVRRQRSFYSRQASLRPDLFGVIIFLEGGLALGESKPRHLGGCINVDIGSQGTRVVKGSDTNESELGAAPVVTPNRNLAFAAAIDVVRTISTANRDGFQRPTYEAYGRSLYNRIDNKRAACVPLAIRAVATVHADGRREQFVAHLAAGTTTPKFLS